MATIEKLNESAEQVAEVSRDSYKTVVDHTAALQERNVKFWQEMFEVGTREIRQQAESNRTMTYELVERAENQRGAFQALVKESVDTYMDLLYAPLAYYKQGLKLVESEVTEGGFPILNYDDLNVEEVGKALDNLSAQELREVREYEKSNKNRETVIAQIDRKLKPAS
ncbi:MAG: hypothetical protein ACFB50_04885 [Rubrobacteraceae bacterium]